MNRTVNKLMQRLIDIASCWRLGLSPVRAFGFLRANMSPEIGRFNIGPIEFFGRKLDWVAIREVLVDDEYRCIDDILAESKLPPRVLDIGANIGTFAIRCFTANPQSKVLSIEAAPDTFEILKKNKDANPGLEWGVIHAGVWSENGEVSLERRHGPMGHRVRIDGGHETVPAQTLDRIASSQHWDYVDLVKMDIEGGEESVIPSAAEFLRNCRILIIEVHKSRIDANKVLSVLRHVYQNHWQLNGRKSKKPVYLLTNDDVTLHCSAHKVII